MCQRMQQGLVVFDDTFNLPAKAIARYWRNTVELDAMIASSSCRDAIHPASGWYATDSCGMVSMRTWVQLFALALVVCFVALGFWTQALNPQFSKFWLSCKCYVKYAPVCRYDVVHLVTVISLSIAAHVPPPPKNASQNCWNPVYLIAKPPIYRNKRVSQ